MAEGERPVRRALLSVWNKQGIVDFARALHEFDLEFVSSGGTAKALRDAGVTVTEVSSLSEYGEFLGGRVKTLHPVIHGGILARPDHEPDDEEMAQRGIKPIDMVVGNLYPFEAALAKSAPRAEIIEMIDIGGPAMVRAAAKNHARVAVITDPDDYSSVIGELDATGGALSAATRKRLALKAFAMTASYDAAIANWLQGEEGESLPDRLLLSATLVEHCRYGENPQQAAAHYRLTSEPPGLVGATQLQGKALSYNNLADADAALGLVSDLPAPAVAIIKHANPCGVAQGRDLADAYRRAKDADPVSAFGGIVAANLPLDAETARELTKIFTEVVLAPAITDEAKEVLAARPNMRVLSAADGTAASRVVRSIAGGLLVQEPDRERPSADGFEVVTERRPSEREIEDLVFAQTVAKHVKSNAIVLAKDQATVGVGAGQMSRVDSVEIATRKAGERATGSVLGSDAFFPFPDGVEAAAAAGVTAIAQPGGSQKDGEVIAAANRLGLAMVMTGIRHFRH